MAIDDFRPETMQRTIAGQAGNQALFHVGDRAFCLYAVVGSHRDRAGLVPAIREVVSSITIGP